MNLSQIILSALLLIAPTTAGAAGFFVDSNRSDIPGCGLWKGFPCKTYSYLMSSGCDSNGCRNNIKPGDSVIFLKGTHREKLTITLTGNSSKPVFVTCDTPAPDCVIDGSGIPSSAYDSLVDISSSQYLVFRNMKIVHIPKDMYGIAFTGNSSHVLIKNNIIDGAGSSNNLIVTGNKSAKYISIVRNQITNCPASSTGCTFFQETDNLAVIGNQFGPVADSGNYDCNTIIGVNNGLIDGNTCRDSSDGFDQGMDSNGKFLINVISRNNRVFGNLKARAFPVSGQFENTPRTVNFLTGPNSIYKNVIQTIGGSCLQPYGGAQDIVMAYNTCINSGGYGSGVWLQTEYDYWVQKIINQYSIFDSTVNSPLPAILLGSNSSTIRACPQGEECPFIDNVFFMKDRPDSYQLISWSPSKAGTGPSYFFTIGMLQGFNGINRNSGNYRTDPMFVNRSNPYELNNVKLAPSSPLIDKGKSFCKSISAGSGNSITVECDKYLPRVFFPSIDSYYRISSSECRSMGTRVADGINYGCFDIQIEGCGIREVFSISGNVINFSGLTCNWKSNAMVHVPWNGSAPDIGALEF